MSFYCLFESLDQSSGSMFGLCPRIIGIFCILSRNQLLLKQKLIIECQRHQKSCFLAITATATELLPVRYCGLDVM